MILFSSWRRRAAWIVLVLALMAATIWTAANVWAGMRLRSTIERLGAAGYPLSLSKATGKPVPAVENAAPYIQAACLLYRAPTDTEPAWTKEPEVSVAELSPEETKQLEAWITLNRESTDLLERAGTRRKCRFERDYSLGFSTPLPEVTPAMGLSNVLRYRAELEARRGDFRSARKSVVMMFALADSFRTDPILIVQLVRWNILRRALSTAGICITADTTSEDLAEWESVLPAEEVFEGSIERALQGEMATVAEYLSPPSQGGSVHGAISEELLRLSGPIGWAARPLVRWDGARYLETMRGLIEACKLPYRESLRQAAELEGAGKSSVGPLSSLLLPTLQGCIRATATARADLAVTKAGVAAERTRATKGRYPEAVNGIDPFTGQPLLYERAPGRISSVGGGTGERAPEWKLRRPEK